MSQKPPTQPDKTVLTVSQQASWSGPLPPPGAMEAYDHIFPGAAKIILEMAINQQNHRLQLETADLKHRIFMEKAGLTSGFLLGFLGIVGGCLLSYAGRDLTGFGVFFVSLGGLVAAAIYQKRTKDA